MIHEKWTMSMKGRRKMKGILFSMNLSFKVCLSSGLTMVCLLLICTLIALFSMWNLTRIEVLLCNILSPESTPLSLASYNWCKVSTSSSSQTKEKKNVSPSLFYKLMD